MLEFRILGPLEVVDDRGPVPLGGPKQRATLAILLLHANRVVSVDRLADDLYAGAPPVTAVTQVQRQISELRKALGTESVIETRAPGYLAHVPSGSLDLTRFEQQTGEAGRAFARGDARATADLLREALALWRGAPLADLAYESFTQVAIGRLEEIRLAALEQRIEAELSLGRHSELIAELTALVTEHPLRESLSGQLMLALYRARRQAEALDVYRGTREALVGRFGIEPTPALRALEGAILNQDPALDLESGAGRPPEDGQIARGAVLVLPSREDRLDALLAVAEPLATSRELIIARLVAGEDELPRAVAAVNARRATLPASARTAVFTTADRTDDIARLIAAHDIDLVLLDGPPDLAERMPADLAALAESSPADLAVLVGSLPSLRSGGWVFVPFGGGEHDWAALEIAGWLAVASGAPLRLVGTKADPQRGRRDASRLLADASIAVQRLAGVDAEPFLAEPSEDGLLTAVDGAAIVVAGISEQWRREGIGASRRVLLLAGRAPTLLVHRGLRPGGLAPRESRTRFTWTLDASTR